MPEKDKRLSRCNEYQRMIENGDWLEAISALGNALEADPDYSGAFFNLGLAYEKGGLTRFARAAYEEYLRIAPDGYWAKKAGERLAALSAPDSA